MESKKDPKAVKQGLTEEQKKVLAEKTKDKEKQVHNQTTIRK